MRIQFKDDERPVGHPAHSHIESDYLDVSFYIYDRTPETVFAYYDGSLAMLTTRQALAQELRDIADALDRDPLD